MPRTRPLVIGHRGAPGYRPEHSRSSYDLALAMGVDGVEPDIVVSRDGVLVVRHENEISGTTDVADRIEYAARRTTKTIDGAELTGLVHRGLHVGRALDAPLPRAAAEAARRRARRSTTSSRCCACATCSTSSARPRSNRAARSASCSRSSTRPTSPRSGGMSRPSSTPSCARPAGPPASCRSRSRRSSRRCFSSCRSAASRRPTSTCSRRRAGRSTSWPTLGKAAPTYRQTAAPAGLDALVGVVDGISVDKRMILAPDKLGRTSGPSPLVADAHARGLRVFTWTCRPENSFLIAQFRGRGGPSRLRRLGGGVGGDPGCRHRRRLRRPRGSRGGVLPRVTPDTCMMA